MSGLFELIVELQQKLSGQSLEDAAQIIRTMRTTHRNELIRFQVSSLTEKYGRYCPDITLRQETYMNETSGVALKVVEELVVAEAEYCLKDRIFTDWEMLISGMLSTLIRAWLRKATNLTQEDNREAVWRVLTLLHDFLNPMTFWWVASTWKNCNESDEATVIRANMIKCFIQRTTSTELLLKLSHDLMDHSSTIWRQVGAQAKNKITMLNEARQRLSLAHVTEQTVQHANLLPSEPQLVEADSETNSQDSSEEADAESASNSSIQVNNVSTQPPRELKRKRTEAADSLDAITQRLESSFVTAQHHDQRKKKYLGSEIYEILFPNNPSLDDNGKVAFGKKLSAAFNVLKTKNPKFAHICHQRSHYSNLVRI